MTAAAFEFSNARSRKTLAASSNDWVAGLGNVPQQFLADGGINRVGDAGVVALTGNRQSTASGSDPADGAAHVRFQRGFPFPARSGATTRSAPLPMVRPR